MTDSYARLGLNLQKQQRQHLSNVQRVDQTTPDVYVVGGRYLIDGMGESIQSVNFPIKFIEIPLFSYGFELAPGHALESGSFPSGTSIITKWSTVSDEIAGYQAQELYEGATIGVSLVGSSGQKIWVHWRMEGVAIVSPVHGNQTAGGYA